MIKNWKSILFVIVFIVCFIGAIIFSKTEPRAMVICIGAIFFIVGIAALFSVKLSLENSFILVFPLVGALMIIIPALMIYADNSDNLDPEAVERLAVNCAICGFTLVGIGLIVIPPLIHNKKMKIFTVSIEACCIDLDFRYSKSKHGGRTKLYAPVWEYDYNGNMYTYKENTYTNVNVPQIREVRQLLLNPDEPSELYRPSASIRIMLLIMGLAFSVMGTIGLIMYNIYS